MPGLLIDDSGEVWPAQPETLARRFGAYRPGSRCPRDFIRWAVTSGFIFVRFSECGARIAFRPHLVSRQGEARLFGLIRQRHPGRVAIARDARLSSWEIMVGAEL